MALCVAFHKAWFSPRMCISLIVNFLFWIAEEIPFRMMDWHIFLGQHFDTKIGCSGHLKKWHWTNRKVVFLCKYLSFLMSFDLFFILILRALPPVVGLAAHWRLKTESPMENDVCVLCVENQDFSKVLNSFELISSEYLTKHSEKLRFATRHLLER